MNDEVNDDVKRIHPGEYFYINGDEILVFTSFESVVSYFDRHIKQGHDVEIVVKPLSESGPNRYGPRDAL